MIVSLVMVLLFETDILESGVLAGEKSSEFVVSSIMDLLTLGMIPLALFFFRIKGINKKLHSEYREQSLMRYGAMRIAMLCVPMMANTLLYYLYMFVGFAYLAIILFLSLFFVYPSLARCVNETDSSNS